MTPADAAQVARLWARALVHGDAALRTKADALLAGWLAGLSDREYRRAHDELLRVAGVEIARLIREERE